MQAGEKPFRLSLEGDEIAFEVRGEFACFTMPVFRVERYSYPCITGSAIAGLAKQIHWHPGIEYEPVSVEILNEIRMTTITANELRDPISANRAKQEFLMGKGSIVVERNETRQQRCTTFLTDVAYRIVIRMIPDESHSSLPFDLKKCRAIFTRRLAQGQYYHSPCLGLRECRCDVTPVPDENRQESFYKGTGAKDLGELLYGIEYVYEGDIHKDVVPHFFHAEMIDGKVIFPSRKEMFR